nr:MAG TPA: hypothetical protein [Caudoviricetes sp.]
MIKPCTIKSKQALRKQPHQHILITHTHNNRP